jgi:quercetin dioxygenase-like cupin family protein
MWYWDALRGAAALLHVHHREDEQFLVVSGRARFIVADERMDAGPGDLVFLPRDHPHAYLIISDTARLVGMVTPGGFEAFFSEVGTAVRPGDTFGSPSRASGY